MDTNIDENQPQKMLTITNMKFVWERKYFVEEDIVKESTREKDLMVH